MEEHAGQDVSQSASGVTVEAKTSEDECDEFFDVEDRGVDGLVQTPSNLEAALNLVMHTGNQQADQGQARAIHTLPVQPAQLVQPVYPSGHVAAPEFSSAHGAPQGIVFGVQVNAPQTYAQPANIVGHAQASTLSATQPPGEMRRQESAAAGSKGMHTAQTAEISHAMQPTQQTHADAHAGHGGHGGHEGHGRHTERSRRRVEYEIGEVDVSDLPPIVVAALYSKPPETLPSPPTPDAKPRV